MAQRIIRWVFNLCSCVSPFWNPARNGEFDPVQWTSPYAPKSVATKMAELLNTEHFDSSSVHKETTKKKAHARILYSHAPSVDCTLHIAIDCTPVKRGKGRKTRRTCIRIYPVFYSSSVPGEQGLRAVNHEFQAFASKLRNVWNDNVYMH